MSKNDLDYCMKNQGRSGRFIEACLLVLLAEKKSYGYNLLERLKEFDYSDDTINMSVIYRNLRAMEKNKLIKSEWASSDLGPDKKIYRLTDLGFEIMDLWMVFLDQRINILENIIKKHKQVKEENDEFRF